MADSWQEIDGDGATMDWTSADTLRLNDIWHVLETIKRATYERDLCQSGGTDFSATIQKLDDIYYWAHKIDDFINGYVPPAGHTTYFADYTQNGGNFEGLSAIPRMTQDRALAIIGDASRVTLAQLSDLPSWLSQTYKIINLMRWGANGNSASGWKAQYKEAYGSDVSSRETAWNNTVALWNAASWTINGSPWVGCHYVCGQFYSGAWRCSFASYRYRFNLKNLVGSYTPPSPNYPLQLAMTVYANAQHFAGDGFASHYGYTENTLHKMLDISERSLPVADEYTPWFGDLTPPTFAQLEGGADTWFSLFWGVQSIVNKFDGPNGLKFRNW